MQTVEAPAPTRHNPAIWNRAAFVLITAFGLISIFLAFRFPLAPDETYYWEWSRRPAWGYYDQGPMIAWWIRTGCMLFGDTVVGVRSTIIVAGALTQWFVFLAARDLFGSRAGVLAVVFSIITPLGLAGGFIATYDPVVVLFWCAALYFSQLAIFGGRNSAWIGVGIALGLGLLSKHTMALFAPCLLLALYLSGRKQWARPIIALAIGSLLFIPNVVWQSSHDWMTFRHLFLLTGKGADQNTARRVAEYIGSQAGLITPLLFLAIIWSMVAALRRGDERSRFLVAFSLPVLAVFVFVALKAKVQANWAICAWPAACILYAAWLDRAETGRAALRYAALSTAVCGAISFFTAFPELRTALGIPFPQKWDQMNKLYGGDELGRAADREKASMEAEAGGTVAAGASTYDQTSRLAFYMRSQPHAICFFLGTRANSYVLWNHEAGLKPGMNAIICDGHSPGDPRFPVYGAIFNRVVPAGAVPIYRNQTYSKPVMTYYLYRCYGYHPNPEVESPKGG